MQNFKDKFVMDFITDDRWHYLTDGLKVTLEITFLAVILGVVIGFILAVVRSTHDKTGKMKIANVICNIYITVIRGTPVVVQLMIIYFVVFGSMDINKILVAILAFGMNSGAYVAEIFRSGIMSIDAGQFEAGRSLGFNYRQTMMYIIMPQAFKNVLPALGNEFIVLLKETSVSGYIALQDLTKGGDIIRSRTYDALLPLLAVALIYLVMVMIFTKLVSILERRLRNSDH
ncbi:amino acid ABC transporter permease [Hespellia stercorisuis]|uniref:Amino acid ABC transporter membrane protein, PAAT family (TC 3.A.1.3.-) n=1 Tax=Hespellia stercorisuis DSM 15480 TaxID=1121950 RepID=A0A1M6JK27_9FIRM|nr:amino acid ABC transporter permease [Hespellia stercorisuis]SHJ47077.1 amino acid ABC transporter membrane protein, PAAT family (TC 3.A.1.3.-) [Hespellia stercorisuis DSM 15480]